MSIDFDGSEWAIGDDPTITFTVTSNGTAVNLTGATVEFLIYDANTGTLVTTLSSSGGSPKITVSSPATGAGTIDLTGSLEALGAFNYRARYTLASKQLTFDRGLFSVV